MGTAYTPGLTVSPQTTITKTRRLPLKGAVLVEEGARVASETVVARAELPGAMTTVKVAGALGIEGNPCIPCTSIKPSRFASSCMRSRRPPIQLTPMCSSM